jgi:hypothetical protein
MAQPDSSERNNPSTFHEILNLPEEPSRSLLYLKEGSTKLRKISSTCRFIWYGKWRKDSSL